MIYKPGTRVVTTRPVKDSPTTFVEGVVICGPHTQERHTSVLGYTVHVPSVPYPEERYSTSDKPGWFVPAKYLRLRGSERYEARMRAKIPAPPRVFSHWSVKNVEDDPRT